MSEKSGDFRIPADLIRHFDHDLCSTPGGRTIRVIFQDDPPFLQFIANAISLRPIFLPPCFLALLDQRLDCGASVYNLAACPGRV